MGTAIIGGGSGGAIVSGQFLCPPTQYAPAALDTRTTSSLTFAQVSPNISTGAFTVPPSGSVLVTASFIGVTLVAATGVAVALAAHGTLTPLIGSAPQWVNANTSGDDVSTIQFLLAGLTPGNSLNLDLMFACGAVADSFNILCLGQAANPVTAGTRGGPVTMSVQAV